MVIKSQQESVKQVYLLHGFIGSGKTTFAKRLANEKRGIRFTHDDFMVALYGTNPPVNKFKDYYENVAALIWQLTASLIDIGVPVILDFGFWTTNSRMEARARVQAMGAEAYFYSLQCSVSVMKGRCLERTQSGGKNLLIDEAAFDSLLLLYEPITVEENIEVIKTD